MRKKLDDRVGRHCVAELGGGDKDLLDDEAFIKKVLREAAHHCGATFLTLASHKFEPQGVTAVALLAESHINFHSWPEHGYAAIDVFTCGDHCDPEVAVKHLKDAFRLTHGHIHVFPRVMPTEPCVAS